MSLEETNEIIDIVGEQVPLCFHEMFGVSALRVKEQSFSDDAAVTKVKFTGDNGLHIFFQFWFPRELVKPLLEKSYDPVMAAHESVIEDAICEITNMVCGSVIGNLCDRGFVLKMSVPRITYVEKDMETKVLNIFTLNFVLEGSIVKLT